MAEEGATEGYKDERVIINDNETQFNKLERAAILSVFESVDILRYANKKPSSKIDIAWDPTKARYSQPVRTHLFGHNADAAVKDADTQATLQKLRHYSAYVDKILEDTKQELRSSGRLSVLAKEIGMMRATRDKENALLKENEETADAVKRLRETIAEEAVANSKEKKRHEDMLLNIRNEVDEIQVKGEAELLYVHAWEKARCEQSALRCNNAETKLNNVLKKFSIEQKHEERVRNDIDIFLKQNIDHNEKEIVYWGQRYTEDLVKYTTEIDKLQNEIDTKQSIVAKLKEEFGEKQKFIDSYLAEKETIRKQKEHEEHVQQSAIRLQAWWRGVMVRRKLGPYRPEEKKKKRATKTKK